MNSIPSILSAVVILGVLAAVTILGLSGVVNGEAITGLLSAIVGGGLVHAARPAIMPSDAPSTLGETSSRPATTETN